MPLGDDVVIRHVVRAVARRNEVRRRRVTVDALEMDAVPQAVALKVRMKVEADEAAFEPRVIRQRERRGHVGVNRRPIAVDDIKEAARVVGEAAAVGGVAHEAHARPTGRRHVLVDRPQAARIRQPHEIPDLDGKAALHERRRQRVVGNLCFSANSRRQQHGADGPRPYVNHASPLEKRAGLEVPARAARIASALGHGQGHRVTAPRRRGRAALRLRRTAGRRPVPGSRRRTPSHV